LFCILEKGNWFYFFTGGEGARAIFAF